MTVEEFFDLFLIELTGNRKLWSYYKFYTSKKKFAFRKAYFCQRLQYIINNIGNMDDAVWDCGCGYGTTALFLAMNNYKVYGTTVEFYFSEIEERKKYWSQYGDVTLFAYKYENLLDTTTTERFDTIILQDTLHHLEPIGKALSLLRQSLKTKGKLLVVEENGSNIVQNLKLFRRRGAKRIISRYDETLKKNILLGNENIRSLARWQSLLKQQELGIQKSSIQYIRFFPPALIKSGSIYNLTKKEAAIADSSPLLTKFFFFGINFIANKL